MDIHIGIELNPKFTDPHERHDEHYEWRYQLWFGEKYEPDSGWTAYTGKKPLSGDVIKMVVEDNDLSFWLNDTYLGVAFIDSWLNDRRCWVYIWMGTEGDWVEVLPGTVST